MRLASTLTIPLLAALAACGGGGGGDGGSGGGGGTAGALPPNAAPIVHDTRVVALNETREALVSETAPLLSDPETAEYPYDPEKPDEVQAQPVPVRVRSLCTTRTYDITSNPDKVVMYNRDGNVSYPGALLQGGAFRAGQLSKLGVRPAHRAPLTFVINNVYNQSASGDPSGTVPNPDLQPVQDAVKARIVAAYNDSIPIGDSVSYSYDETSNIGRFMLKAKVSARYGGISGELGTKIDKRSSERSVVIHLVQKLFDVEVQQPPTRNDWFNAEFFNSGVQPLVASGELSATDSPVYVSKVSYGKVMTFTLKTSASRSDIDLLVKASVKTLVAGGTFEGGTKIQNVNRNKSVKVTQIGGSGADAVAAAESGDWGAYFKKNLLLTQAAPIMVEYRNLYDNSPAGITETTQATEEICTPQLVVPGPFDFALEDVHERPAGIGGAQQVASGDFNGDRIDDVVWNQLVGSTNRLYVAYGSKGGRLRVDAKPCGGAACDFSDPAVPWGQFKLKVGDFNGDGRADLMWLQANPNLPEVQARVLLAAADGSGFAGPLVALNLPMTADERAGMRPDALVADMNNDGRADLLLWFVTRNASNQNLVDQRLLRSDIGGAAEPFAVQPRARVGAFTDLYNSNPATAAFTLVASDINSDGWKDLMLMLKGQSFNASTVPERNVVVQHLNLRGAAAPLVSFGNGTTFVHGSLGGWDSYLPLMADFDGDGAVDAAWVNRMNSTTNPNVGALHQAKYDLASGQFVQQNRQFWRSGAADAAVNLPKLLQNFNDGIFVADTNGDAAQDIVATRFLPDAQGRLTVNGIAVAKGLRAGNPMFNVLTDPQKHPVVQDWSGYTWLLTGDFNGDGLQDVLWNNAALDNSSYIAFAKRDEQQAAF